MLFNKRTIGMLISTLLVASLPTLAHADLAEVIKQCDTCHGKNGVSKDGKVPTIAGFSAATIVEILPQYQSGARAAEKYTPKGGKASDMKEATDGMSPADMQVLGDHYAKQKFVAANQSTDAALAAKGAKVHDKSCEKCHSEGGGLADDDAGILAGQWKPYLERQFALIKAGKRDIPKKMKKKLDKLSADDVKAVTEYYASQK